MVESDRDSPQIGAGVSPHRHAVKRSGGAQGVRKPADGGNPIGTAHRHQQAKAIQAVAGLIWSGIM